MKENNNNESFEGLGKLLDHNYDNIRELNNPLPGWWLVTFYGTIIFAIIYYSYYTFFGGPNLDAELQKGMQEIQSSSVSSQSVNKPQHNFAVLLTKKEILTQGRAVYEQRCLACHGQKGEGLIGPNLTDKYWIHGDGSPESIFETARKGVLEKGMPAWENVVSGDDLAAAAVYIKSIQGSNPPNPKAPQGNLVQ